ncbi:response regulator [Propionibacteriaceae bacterium Y2011]|uniref:response regulator n=1 Tax=Microlunatus sp. Y2014 TaxID=3418488 RepID=UPI003D57C5E7
MIVDDQEVVRRGLGLMLELAGGFAVVAEAPDAATALTLVRTGRGGGPVRPQVALLDARMPRMSGMELIPLLRAEVTDLTILVVSTFDDDDVVLGSLRAGADGFFLKDASPDELRDGIHQALAGRTVIDPRVGSQVVSALAQRAEPRGTRDDELIEALTHREREVTAMVAEGLSNRVIARRLQLREGTVKNHVSAALRKSGAQSRTELAVWWRDG